MSAEFERLIVDAKRRFQIALDCARLFERVFDIAHPVEHDGELAAVEALPPGRRRRPVPASAGRCVAAAIAHLVPSVMVDVIEAVERHDQQPDPVVGRPLGAALGGCSRRRSPPRPGVVPPPSLESSAAVPARSASGRKCLE